MDKIALNISQLEDRIKGWKEEGCSIVFTNGVFDLLHRGHLTYLREAATLGDRLIIGINTDASVKRLKGEKRPVNCLEDRMYMLSCLSCVDMVVPFEEDTPLDLIKHVRPDILVKGGDYKIKNIVGFDYVRSYNGSVKVLSLIDGYSSTLLIEKIKSL